MHSSSLVSRMQRWSSAPGLQKLCAWCLQVKNRNNKQNNHGSHLLSTCCIPGLELDALTSNLISGEAFSSLVLLPSITDFFFFLEHLGVLPPRGLAPFPLSELSFTHKSTSHLFTHAGFCSNIPLSGGPFLTTSIFTLPHLFVFIALNTSNKLEIPLKLTKNQIVVQSYKLVMW